MIAGSRATIRQDFWYELSQDQPAFGLYPLLAVNSKRVMLNGKLYVNVRWINDVFVGGKTWADQYARPYRDNSKN